MPPTPQTRLRQLNDAPPRADRQFVLYWMLAARRTRYNFGLQRAIEAAKELGRPLVVLETLPCGRRWDCDRFHDFVLDGMADNARRLRDSRATYYPYVERSRGDSRELVAALGEIACAVVTDDLTAHSLPDDLAQMAPRLPVRAEAVDSNGLVPLEAAPKAFTTAHSFRRFVQDELLEHLGATPTKNPLARLRLPDLHRLPAGIVRRWPSVGPDLLARGHRTLNALPIGHSVPPVAARGGTTAARAVLRRFLDERLSRYADDRNQPEKDVTSGLSPYLHYGHISAHEVFSELMGREGWSPGNVSPKPKGSRSGWWGVSAPAEAFLDQLVTWRELGYNMCWHRRDHHRYGSLPEWARRTLGEHASDLRPYVYGIDQLEQGRTHDALWNAAQMQLVREGRLHNYLRMLWGKKILEWSPTPEDALEAMVELNNKYALDGQDPNSYSGIFWILGRYDRPWGPERPIFGKVRYMSSENTARKVRVRDYIRRYAP